MTKLTLIPFALTTLVLAPGARSQVEARIAVLGGVTTGRSNSNQATFVWIRINEIVISVPLKASLSAADVSLSVENALVARDFTLVRDNATALRVLAAPSRIPSKRVPVTDGATIATNDPGLSVGTAVTRFTNATPNTKHTGVGFALADPARRSKANASIKIAAIRETKNGPEVVDLAVGVTTTDSGDIVNKKILKALQDAGFDVNQVVWPSLVDQRETSFVNIDRTTTGTGVIGCTLQPELHQLGLLETIESVAASKALFGFTDYGDGVSTSFFSSRAWIEGVGFPKPGADLITVSHMQAAGRPCVRLLGAKPIGLVLPGLPPLLVDLNGVILLPFVAAPVTGDFEMRLRPAAVNSLTGLSLFLQDIRVDPGLELGTTQGMAVTLGRM